uniref:Uncharacterized protein n=1 Tax=Panagrellus redivivus TaxID=6233 RepID=A0A7E4ZSK7_PANRE
MSRLGRIEKDQFVLSSEQSPSRSCIGIIMDNETMGTVRRESDDNTLERRSSCNPRRNNNLLCKQNCGDVIECNGVKGLIDSGCPPCFVTDPNLVKVKPFFLPVLA